MMVWHARRMLPGLCAAAFLSVLLLQGAAAQTTFTTYPLDWANVPATPPTSRDLTANCSCNLRRDACNINCCCDQDCPAGLVELYQGQGTCLPQGADQQILSYCVPDGYVAKVNLPSSGDFYAITKQQAEMETWSQLMCIVSDSNPNLGKQYPDPEAGVTSENVALAQCPVPASPPARIDGYQYRSPIYASRTAADPVAPLTVPHMALSQLCSDQFVVGFMTPVPVGNLDVFEFCQRDLSALDPAVACSGSGLLTAQYWTDMSVVTGSPDAPSTMRPVTVRSWQYLNPATGALLPANGTTSAFDPATGLCTNVVAQLNITFFYILSDEDDVSVPGYIDTVEVTLLVTDHVSSIGPLRQGVKVNWLPTAVPQPIDVQNSGNPGYIRGFPLLAGTLATTSEGGVDKSAVRRLVGGMPLPVPSAAGRGACSPTSQESVRFGYNTTSTCSVSLTLAELQDFCTTQQDQPQKYVQMVMGALYDALTAQTDSQLYMGIWGDSDFNDINQWLKVERTGYPFNPSIFSQTDNACSGVIVGFDLQLVVGVAFASNNLQNKVLFANLCFKTGVWDFSGTGPNPQRFFLDFSVNYITIPQQAEEVKKPAPPLVIPLPADLFYPFVAVTGDAGAVRAPGWMVMLPVFLAVLLFAQALRD